MTYRQLLDQLQKFVNVIPSNEALDRQVIVRLGVQDDDDDELHVGGLQSVTIDCGCTDEYALVLDADQDPEEM